MSTFTQFCGIDVSHDTLDYCLLVSSSTTEGQFGQIANKSLAIKDRFGDSKFDNTLFILESTGTYSSKSLYELTKLNRCISLVSPFKSKSYMSARGVTNKNDKQAAFCLALMGKQMDLQLYKAPSEELQKRKQIMSCLAGLQKQERMLKNQLHALAQLPPPLMEEVAKTALELALQGVMAQIEPLKKCLYDPSSDPQFNDKKKYGSSVVGIGNKSAEAILLVTNGLDGFANADKVSKFLGLTPLSHNSGTSVRRKGRITKFGSNNVRKLLYMCARSARKHNKPCKALYERLRKKGKPHKVAAVAVMHKLVKQFYACVTSKTLFDREYHLKNKNKA